MAHKILLFDGCTCFYSFPHQHESFAPANIATLMIKNLETYTVLKEKDPCHDLKSYALKISITGK